MMRSSLPLLVVLCVGTTNAHAQAPSSTPVPPAPQVFTLPDALIKFRQGVGRLIRTQSDRGLVTLLDSRLLAKSYGRLFLDCLPQTEFTTLTRETRSEKFHPFA